MKRKFIGVELKKSYFNVRVENLKNADIKSNDKGFLERMRDFSLLRKLKLKKEKKKIIIQ
jgi:hypothetical protein